MTPTRRIAVLVGFVIAASVVGATAASSPPEQFCGICGGYGPDSGEGLELSNTSVTVEVFDNGSARWTERARIATRPGDGQSLRGALRGRHLDVRTVVDDPDLTLRVEGRTVVATYRQSDAARTGVGGVHLFDAFHTEPVGSYVLEADRLVVRGPDGTTVVNEPPGATVRNGSAVWTGGGYSGAPTTATYVAFGTDDGLATEAGALLAISLDVGPMLATHLLIAAGPPALVLLGAGLLLVRIGGGPVASSQALGILAALMVLTVVLAGFVGISVTLAAVVGLAVALVAGATRLREGDDSSGESPRRSRVRSFLERRGIDPTQSAGVLAVVLAVGGLAFLSIDPLQYGLTGQVALVVASGTPYLIFAVGGLVATRTRQRWHGGALAVACLCVAGGLAAVTFAGVVSGSDQAWFLVLVSAAGLLFALLGWATGTRTRWAVLGSLAVVPAVLAAPQIPVGGFGPFFLTILLLLWAGATAVAGAPLFFLARGWRRMSETAGSTHG